MLTSVHYQIPLNEKLLFTGESIKYLSKLAGLLTERKRQSLVRYRLQYLDIGYRAVERAWDIGKYLTSPPNVKFRTFITPNFLPSPPPFTDRIYTMDLSNFKLALSTSHTAMANDRN